MVQNENEITINNLPFFFVELICLQCNIPNKYGYSTRKLKYKRCCNRTLFVRG